MRQVCPSCREAFVPSLSEREGEHVVCPRCGTEVSTRLPTAKRVPARAGCLRSMIIVCLLFVGISFLFCFSALGLFVHQFAPSDFPEPTVDYAEARKTFQTQLVYRFAAPSEEVKESAPRGVSELVFTSGKLKLKAWTTPPQAPFFGKKRPVVIYLHDGFRLTLKHWEETAPFREAGYIVMTPMLRGENGLPGDYSMFYNEVDDLLAATETLAKRTDVDGNRVFLVGRGEGGTVALLAAMTSKRFHSVVAINAATDAIVWSRNKRETIPFEESVREEFAMRSPLAYYQSFKCPVRLYFMNTPELVPTNIRLGELARGAGADLEASVLDGDSEVVFRDATRYALLFFQSQRK